ncbi:MAG TPA: phBC6A51 family helix-turn-helix protein [Bacteroidia bacterium]|jgi:biotin operon repressor|nr:phBC6A51 family helix-turn-helix protein [Bacteroidia bacterium]
METNKNEEAGALQVNEKRELMQAGDSNNDLWEGNHLLITGAINLLMRANGRMPTKIEIAEKTGLSRKTIHKHIKDLKDNPLFQEQDEQFKLVKGSMLSLLHNMAFKGDVKAIKLFMEATGILGNSKTVNKNIIENQHNYIQINETRLSQEQIKKLSPERLKQIEELLRVPEVIKEMVSTPSTLTRRGD